MKILTFVGYAASQNVEKSGGGMIFKNVMIWDRGRFLVEII